jgi:hypothetical protein
MPVRARIEDPYMSIPVSEFEALHQRIRDLENAIRSHINDKHDFLDRLRSVL